MPLDWGQLLRGQERMCVEHGQNDPRIESKEKVHVIWGESEKEFGVHHCITT